MKLIIGTKTYSSWSLRPWIAMVEAGIAFDEQVIALRQPDSSAALSARTPAGLVPVLHDGGNVVWETLAILEYLAERFPKAGLWPSDLAARTHARAISAEMHAGFAPLRRHLPMNFRRSPRARAHMPDDVAANIARIQSLWTSARARFGADGPFLYGARFGAADAMYAPVVHRFHVYDVPLSPVALQYRDAVMATRAYRRWHEEALAEPEEWMTPDLAD